MQKLVKYKTNTQGVRTIPQKNQYATQIAAILKSHAGSFITLLNDITNTETAALILASIYEVFPFYLSHRRLLKQILTAVVNVWSSSSDIDTQISTFAFLNNVSREYPKSVLETVLKLTYSSFLQNCRKTNVHTMAQINFCKTQLWNCLESMKLWVIKLVLSMLDNWLYIYVTVSMLLRTQRGIQNYIQLAILSFIGLLVQSFVSTL